MTKRQRTTEKLFSKAFEILSECPAPTKNGPKLVGTHDGTFHCDEALGCAMLQMMPQWAGSTIVRTRNLEELAKCDIVIDVGAVYDHATKRYDHHQRTFSSVLGEVHPDVPEASRPDFNTKLSACGLVYKHYGMEQLLPALTDGSGLPATLLPVIYRKMYKGFVEEVDANPNPSPSPNPNPSPSPSPSLSPSPSPSPSLDPNPNPDPSPNPNPDPSQVDAIDNGIDIAGDAPLKVS